jgi:U4/U6 small nuclear ribonucleoprotein PRP3
MADLAEKKAKLLEQKKLAAEQAALTAVASASLAAGPPVTAAAPPPPPPTAVAAATAPSAISIQQAAALAAARAAAAALSATGSLAMASSSSSSSSSSSLFGGGRDGPMALRLDSQGREIDEHGNVLQKAQRAVASSLANRKLMDQQSEASRREASEARAKAMLKLGDEAAAREAAVSGRAAAKGSRSIRQAHGLAFVEPGMLSDKAEKERDERIARELKKKENAMVRPTIVDPIVDREAIESAQRVPLGRAAAAAAALAQVSGGVPAVEWWDAPLLADPSSYDANLVGASDTASTSAMQVDGGAAVRAKDKAVTFYVEHPVPVKPLVVTKPPPPPKAMLTKKEMKRIRKQNRADREQARRERVLLGLEQEKAPKVSLSNMMRVHGTSAIMDPTALEAVVQKQVAERKQKHERDNAERALTPAQRREKKRRKLIDDTAAGTHVAVYRVRDLTHPQRRYKVNWTAKELLMTGCAVTLPSFSVVVVEGGAKAQGKFKKLMLRRIDWTSNTPITSEYFKHQLAAQLAGVDPDAAPPTAMHADDADAGSGDGAFELDADAQERLSAALQPDCSANECMLVWEGVVAVRAFKAWSMETAATERAARYFLRQHNVEHYFNVVATANEAFGVKSLE